MKELCTKYFAVLTAVVFLLAFISISVLYTYYTSYNGVLTASPKTSLHESIIIKLDQTIAISNEAIAGIHKRWEVQKFPNFLDGVKMSPEAWDVLNLKFQEKIIRSLILSNPSQNHTSDASVHESLQTFVMGFMGSSVTAGHDSLMNQSVSALVGPLMSPAFSHLGIKLVSRSGAIGNNPCLPYDLCPRVFAGADADLIQWEQVSCSTVQYHRFDAPVSV